MRRSRHTFIHTLTAMLLALSVVRGGGAAESIVNPASYRSPSGRYTLSIDPTDMHGRGDSRCTMRDGDRMLFSVTHPFTMCEAVVADDGAVGGYAKSARLGAESDFEVIILNPEGEVRLRQSRRGAAGAGADSVAGDPHVRGVRGILSTADGDRFMLRLATDGGDETWPVYQLSVGAQESEMHVTAPRVRRGVVRVLAADVVPEAPLILVHWYVHELAGRDDSISAHFSLISFGGEEVWRLELDGEYDGMGEDWNWWWDLARPGVRQTNVRKGGFTVHSFRDEQSLRFSVEARDDAPRGWLIRQIDRRTLQLTLSSEAFSATENHPAPPTIDLQPAGAFTLGQPADPAARRAGRKPSHAPRFGRIESLVVAPSGKVYALSERTERVHVFDVHGRELSRSGSLGSADRAGPIAIRGDEIFAADQRGSCYVSLGAMRTRLTARRASGQSRVDRWIFQPSGGMRWEIGDASIRLVDEQGAVAQVITRRPNNKWLQQTFDASLAADGSLAVVTGPVSANAPAGLTLNIYRADGRPVRAIDLQWESVYARVAFNGVWAVTSEDSVLYMYNVASNDVFRFELPVADGLQAWWHPYISPDGTELWVRNAGSTTFLRYRLPD